MFDTTLSDARILVVDDSKMMRLALMRMLAKLGLTHITEAANGQVALGHLADEAFDLMLLDMEMPVMDGREVLRQIRQRHLDQACPVIVISGLEDVEAIVECIQLGADDYLKKPFNEVLFRARLFSSLEKNKLRQREKEQKVQLEKSKKESDDLLLNILPESISRRLKEDEGTIADAYESVTVLFADLVGFTQLSKNLSATALVKYLDDIFSNFDRITQNHQLEKIKTIGDCYMLVGGAPESHAQHAHAAVRAALDMHAFLTEFNARHQTTLQMRIGIHTGPAVAGVIGLHKFTYDLWGNTVNIASRMESSGQPGQTHISSATRAMLAEDFDCQPCEPMQIKGIGLMDTYYVLSSTQALS